MTCGKGEMKRCALFGGILLLAVVLCASVMWCWTGYRYVKLSPNLTQDHKPVVLLNNLALDGYCPVTLKTNMTWQIGDARWGVIHRDRTYLFASQDYQQTFLLDPERFSPGLAGYDPVRFANAQEVVEGKREHGVFFNDGYYLFADEESLTTFSHEPGKYVEVVRRATQEADNRRSQETVVGPSIRPELPPFQK